MGNQVTNITGGCEPLTIPSAKIMPVISDGSKPTHRGPATYTATYSEVDEDIMRAHFGWTYSSQAESDLDDYCGTYGDGKCIDIRWSTCPECEHLFMPKDDYLCRGCRASL
jgi:hypothetical protein